MNGGLGVYGVITELLMQMTKPTYTTLITVEQSDANMFKDVQKLLKVRHSSVISILQSSHACTICICAGSFASNALLLASVTEGVWPWMA